MSSKDFGEDAAFLLYLVPIVASIIYGVVEWVATAKTASMPSTAYLIVSKSPYLFLISVVAICLALILEMRSASQTDRVRVIEANTTRMQILAVIVLIVSFFAALSTAGGDFGNAFSFFVNGRYALIFAFFLIGISLLLSPKQVLGNVKLASIPDVVGLLLIVVSPVLFYGGLKVHLGFTASAVGSLIVAIIGFVLLVTGSRLFAKKPQKAIASTQVATTPAEKQQK